MYSWYSHVLVYMESMRGDLLTKPLLFFKFVEHVCVMEVDHSEAIFYVFLIIIM